MKIIEHLEKTELLTEAANLFEILFAIPKPILFLTSGGSAFDLLDYIPPERLTANVTISVLDERFSPSTKINNFAGLLSTDIYRTAKKQGSHFIDTRPKKGESIEGLASRFEDSLRQWVETHLNGIIIATMGIGEDGHTAGIFPFPDDSALFGETFNNAEQWVVGYDAGDKNRFPLRATTTIPFLRLIDFAVIYATGNTKLPALIQATHKTTEYYATPARVILDLPQAILLTDQPLTSLD